MSKYTRMTPKPVNIQMFLSLLSHAAIYIEHNENPLTKSNKMASTMTFAAIVFLLLSSRGGVAMFERGRRQMLEKYGTINTCFRIKQEQTLFKDPRR